MQPVETVADPRTTPVLVNGARTPVGRFRGALSNVPAVELGAHAVRAALARCPGLPPDYIAMGNVLQAANGQNPGRRAAILGGVARQVPGITLNDVCLASMSAVALAAAMVRAHEAACVLAGGFDSMTGAPHAVHMRTGDAAGDRSLIDVMHHDGLWCAVAASGMGELSDQENDRLGIDRARQDAFALESHRRAAAATENGRLAEEIAPLQTTYGELRHDEGIRADTSLELLAGLRPAFTPAGTITAGNASQLSDAAAAGLIASLHTAREAGLQPLAEIIGRAVVAGPDSTLHLRPAEAAERLLAQHQLTAADIDLWEINEAFAGVTLASIDALHIDPERVNVNGGAIAVGHPLAASGFRLLLTLAIELKHRGATFGIAAMCGGGGQGEAILLRKLSNGD
jgi:acetyl-CoA C-acetyltransferase